MFIVTETLSMFGRSLEQRKKEKRRKETIEKEKSMIDNQKFGTAAALQKVGVCRFLRTSNAPKSSSSCSFAFSLTHFLCPSLSLSFSLPLSLSKFLRIKNLHLQIRTDSHKKNKHKSAFKNFSEFAQKKAQIRIYEFVQRK